MALDASDLVESFLDDQARVNAAVDNGDINNLVAEVFLPTSEVIGMGTETLTTSVTHPPHKWSDGQSAWGFVVWS